MSVVVSCTIRIDDRGYDSGAVDQEIFIVHGHGSMTGRFSELPKRFIEDALEIAIERAESGARDKLNAIKGEK